MTKPRKPPPLASFSPYPGNEAKFRELIEVWGGPHYCSMNAALNRAVEVTYEVLVVKGKKETKG